MFNVQCSYITNVEFRVLYVHSALVPETTVVADHDPPPCDRLVLNLTWGVPWCVLYFKNQHPYKYVNSNLCCVYIDIKWYKLPDLLTLELCPIAVDRLAHHQHTSFSTTNVDNIELTTLVVTPIMSTKSKTARWIYILNDTRTTYKPQ